MLKLVSTKKSQKTFKATRNNPMEKGRILPTPTPTTTWKTPTIPHPTKNKRTSTTPTERISIQSANNWTTKHQTRTTFQIGNISQTGTTTGEAEDVEEDIKKDIKEEEEVGEDNH
jgi:hypothetical protein